MPFVGRDNCCLKELIMKKENRNLSLSKLGFLVLSAFVSMPGYAADMPPEGAVMRSIFGDDIEDKLWGVRISGLLMAGYVHNFRDNPSDGGLNGPIIPMRDTGFQVNNIGFKIDRPLKTNIIPRGFALPGPVPESYDFGFETWVTYGRNSIAGISPGWDDAWGSNDMDPAKARADRHNYISNQELFLKAYMPWGNGVEVILGKFFSPISGEIGLGLRQHPIGNFFYSRPYLFTGEPVTHTGVLASVNLWRGEDTGLWMGEIGLVQGWQSTQDNNSGKSILGALHWRSMDLKYGLDYRIYYGPDQNDPSKQAQFGNSRLLANNAQDKQLHSIGGYAEIVENWRVYTEMTYGKQDGDGKVTTIDIINGPGFNGAKWNGQLVGLIYQHTPKLGFGARVERFSDPDGFGLYPITSTGSKYKAVTVAASYILNDHVRLRTELRHDKQFDNDGVNLYNGKDNNTALSTDITVWF